MQGSVLDPASSRIPFGNAPRRHSQPVRTLARAGAKAPDELRPLKAVLRSKMPTGRNQRCFWYFSRKVHIILFKKLDIKPIKFYKILSLSDFSSEGAKLVVAKAACPLGLPHFGHAKRPKQDGL